MISDVLHHPKRALFVGASLIVILLAMAGVVSAQSEDSAAVGVNDPPSASADGGNVDVEIGVSNVKNLGGFQLVLTVDSNLVEPVSVVKGAFLGSSGREVFCPDPTISGDSVRLECVTLRDRPDGPDGDGVIAVVTLKPRAAGTSSLALSHVRLVQPDGTEIPSTTTDSKLSIDSGNGWFTGTRLLIVIAAAVFVVALVAVVLRRVLGRRRVPEAISPDRADRP